MGFLGFESSKEKQIRLEIGDLQNEIGQLKAKQSGKPYFGFRYEDDERNRSSTSESILEIVGKISKQ